MKNNGRICGFLLAASLLASSPSFTQVEKTGGASARRGSGDVFSRQGPGTAARQPEVDLAALKRQLQAFQNILNRGLQQTFERPFSILQDAKGAYLPHFGVVFHLEVNLHPMRWLTPFDPRPYTPEELRQTQESKRERIQQLKLRLSELLLEHGEKLSAVPREQNIAIVVHFFNLPSEQDGSLPSQLVLETSRRRLLHYRAGRLTPEQFREKEFFLEF